MMNKHHLSRWFLLGTFLLSGCDAAEKKHYEQRQLTLNRNNAQYYLSQCVQAIERRRALPGDSEGTLPEKLDGKNCESQFLGDFALDPKQAKVIKKSLIKLDPSKLSAYVIEVHSLDGEFYSYVDRGVTAAEAEQAGTFADSSAGGTLPAVPDHTEGDVGTTEVQENNDQ